MYIFIIYSKKEYIKILSCFKFSNILKTGVCWGKGDRLHYITFNMAYLAQYVFPKLMNKGVKFTLNHGSYLISAQLIC